MFASEQKAHCITGTSSPFRVISSSYLFVHSFTAAEQVTSMIFNVSLFDSGTCKLWSCGYRVRRCAVHPAQVHV